MEFALYKLIIIIIIIIREGKGMKQEGKIEERERKGKREGGKERRNRREE